MSDSRLLRIETPFNECLALPESERGAFLDARCGDDRALRDEIADLIVRDARDDAASLPSLIAPPHAGAMPQSISPYRLVERLGEGGFGEVFAAEQTAPVRRRVALKILKAGMDTKAVLARFEAERQALALMDHPGIAKVLDAGETEQGRPYFVMELVSGESITDHCDRHALSTNARLQLMADVCRAVEHAHQKGVIHRDIKPSNLLVTTADGKPLPKVIDFGIAKATEAALFGETLHTRAGEFLGTPEYMSPEQAESGGADVDTRTDVYSLGVVLYRLLTGRLPFESDRMRRAGISEAQRILREEEPPRPSTVARATVRGELDWIVGKAMEKDRAQRYPSAAALADDIERALRDEPVLASPPSTAYRMRKLVRRHRALVAGAAAVIVALVAGIVATTSQAVRATRAERESRKQADVATAVNAFLAQMLGEANPERNPRGRDVTVREMVDQAAGTVGDAWGSSPQIEAGVRHTLGTTYIGLGLYDEAEAQLRRALEIRERAAGRRARETIETVLALAEMEGVRGHSVAGDSLLREIERAVAESDPSDDELRASYLALRAGALGNMSRFVESDSLFAAATAIRRRMPDGGASVLALVLGDHANIKRQQGRFDEAEALAREALDVARRAHPGDHHDVAAASSRLAVIMQEAGRLAEAERLFRETVTIGRSVLGSDHSRLAQWLQGLGAVLTDLGRPVEGETFLREALAIHMRAPDEAGSLLTTAQSLLATTLQALGRYDETLALRQASLAGARAQYGEMHRDVGTEVNNIGAVYRLMKRYDEAAIQFRDALVIFRALHGNEHPVVAVSTHNLGKTLLDAGRPDEAEPLLRQALELGARVFPAGHANFAIFTASHGRALGKLGRYEEGERELLDAHARLTAALGEGHPRLREVAVYLATMYTAWGRRADAQRWRRAAEAPPAAR